MSDKLNLKGTIGFDEIGKSLDSESSQQLKIKGIASAPIVDIEGEVIGTEAYDGAIKDFNEKSAQGKVIPIFIEHRKKEFSLPVGKVTKLFKTNKGLGFEGVVAAGSNGTILDTTQQLIKQGMLNSVSIGGDALNHSFYFDNNLKKNVRKITAMTFRELSLTGLPVNPDAVFEIAKSQKSKSLLIKFEKQLDLLEKFNETKKTYEVAKSFKNNATEDDLKHIEDVLNQLGRMLGIENKNVIDIDKNSQQNQQPGPGAGIPNQPGIPGQGQPQLPQQGANPMAMMAPQGPEAQGMPPQGDITSQVQEGTNFDQKQGDMNQQSSGSGEEGEKSDTDYLNQLFSSTSDDHVPSADSEMNTEISSKLDEVINLLKEFMGAHGEKEESKEGKENKEDNEEKEGNKKEEKKPKKEESEEEEPDWVFGKSLDEISEYTYDPLEDLLYDSKNILQKGGEKNMECRKCGSAFEKSQDSEQAINFCPVCGTSMKSSITKSMDEEKEEDKDVANEAKDEGESVEQEESEKNAPVTDKPESDEDEVTKAIDELFDELEKSVEEEELEKSVDEILEEVEKSEEEIDLEKAVDELLEDFEKSEDSEDYEEEISKAVDEIFGETEDFEKSEDDSDLYDGKEVLVCKSCGSVYDAEGVDKAFECTCPDCGKSLSAGKLTAGTVSKPKGTEPKENSNGPKKAEHDVSGTDKDAATLEAGVVIKPKGSNVVSKNLDVETQDIKTSKQDTGYSVELIEDDGDFIDDVGAPVRVEGDTDMDDSRPSGKKLLGKAPDSNFTNYDGKTTLDDYASYGVSKSVEALAAQVESISKSLGELKTSGTGRKGVFMKSVDNGVVVDEAQQKEAVDMEFARLLLGKK